MAIALNQHGGGSKAAQEKLREQAHLLKTTLNATPDIVSLQDLELVYRVVNTAFSRFVSKEEKDIIGKTDFDLFPEDMAEKNRQENLKVMDTGKPLEREDEIEAPQGKRWWHMLKMPVYGPDGNMTGVLWSGRDVTEVKRIKEKLIQFQKMESMGPLAAGIAHELNTPLGIILGYAQLLKEDFEEDSPIREGLETVENQSKICRKIVGDLLRYSRHTASTFTTLDINQSIEEVVSVVEHIFNMDRVTIRRDYRSNLPPILGDKDKLKQVFVNLLNNAREAIGTDGAIAIGTGFDKDNHEVVISVADNGRGIPPEDMDRIFDPFFTTKTVGEGTGLGLSVTFGIIQEHGGRIEVQSPPWSPRGEQGVDARGTVFIIHLPVSEDRGLKEKKGEIGDGKDTGIG